MFFREGTIWKRSKPASIELSMAAVVKTLSILFSYIYGSVSHIHASIGSFYGNIYSKGHLISPAKRGYNIYF